MATNWGVYEPAIRRWEEMFGRPAPSPVEMGMKGKPRLSPLFVEWMMGLPEGWVTAVPMIEGSKQDTKRAGKLLTRPQQLRLLGNGVVPHQVLLALVRLLDSRVTVW